MGGDAIWLFIATDRTAVVHFKTIPFCFYPGRNDGSARSLSIPKLTRFRETIKRQLLQ
jgi:hypothetical protein